MLVFTQLARSDPQPPPAPTAETRTDPQTTLVYYRLEMEPLVEHHGFMKTVLQLDKLTRTEKLRAMEELWEDLSKPEESFASPDWHGDVLRERDQALKEGRDEFIPWDQAKREIRDAAK